jgi:hypothetical protein
LRCMRDTGYTQWPGQCWPRRPGRAALAAAALAALTTPPALASPACRERFVIGRSCHTHSLKVVAVAALTIEGERCHSDHLSEWATVPPGDPHRAVAVPMKKLV